MVSVVGNVLADRNAELIRAVRSGDLDSVRVIQRSLLPLVDAVMRTSQGAIMAKAALAELGIIPYATVRLPLLQPPPHHLEQLNNALATMGTRPTIRPPFREPARTSARHRS